MAITETPLVTIAVLNRRISRRKNSHLSASMASAVVAPDGYYRNASGQFARKARKGHLSKSRSSESMLDNDAKLGTGKVFAGSFYDAASDDSSSLNRKTTNVNGNARSFYSSDYGTSSHGGDSSLFADPVFPVPVSEMSIQERREWRKKLKYILEQVRNLSLKIEAREQQLKESSNSGVNPSFSDAQFSGNDVRSYAGKEVTSVLGPKAHPIARHHSLPALDTSQLAPDLSRKEKRTPKANQLYRNSDFFMANDKMPPAEKVKSKRPALVRTDSRDSKRQMLEKIQNKQTGEMFRQCCVLLKKLMSHKHAWVFNQPVDAAKLGLSDYHLIIKNPMDFGTINDKLERKDYVSPLQFAEDVRLTFSNATTYNPPGTDVHVMAQLLRAIFEEKWKLIQTKYEQDCRKIEHELKASSQPSISEPPASRSELLTPHQKYQKPESCDPSQAKSQKVQQGGKKIAPPEKSKPKPKPRAQLPQRDMTFLEKKRLSGNLQLLPPHKLEYIVQLMKERNPNLSQKDDEIEVDIDTFDNGTLWELHRYVTNCMKNMRKNKKKLEQNQQQQEPSAPRNEGAAADSTEKVVNKNWKGELGDQDVDMVVDLPDTRFRPVERDNTAGYRSRSSSSGSSSSDSESSSDSDSGSSSCSDSDVEGAQSAGGKP